MQMPDPVAAHYRNLLARHYAWMVGLSFDEKVAEQRALLQPILADVTRGLALDLGSGPGYQTFALAQLGFAPVLAFDTSADLLGQLADRIGGLPIRVRSADIVTLADHVQPGQPLRGQVSAIVCMGDTLTHLPSRDAVRSLFASIAAALAPGGVCVLTWRDLTAELTGANRFIPVRSDDDRIMTCFLETTSAETVEVHDLIYSRTAAGWTLEKSSYPKLRLAPAWVADELAAAGLAVRPQTQAGRLCLAVAQKA